MKFPLEFDALDLATDDLKTKLLPVSRRLKELEKERGERRKVRKRTKAAAPAASSSTPATVPSGEAGGDVTMGDETTAESKPAAGGELEDESVYRAKEIAELEALLSDDVKKDIGSSGSGLYDLVGELVPSFSRA